MCKNLESEYTKHSSMINEATIRKIVDYMLLNACSINSSGLYSGKAGIALTLFEVARYLVTP